MKFKGSNHDFEVGQVYRIVDIDKWFDSEVIYNGNGKFENGDIITVFMHDMGLPNWVHFKNEKGSSYSIWMLTFDSAWDDNCIELISDVERVCDNCGKEVRGSDSARRHLNKFCSGECSFLFKEMVKLKGKIVKCIRCTDDEFTVGDVYEIVDNFGKLVITDDYGCDWNSIQMDSSNEYVIIGHCENKSPAIFKEVENKNLKEELK